CSVNHGLQPWLHSYAAPRLLSFLLHLHQQQGYYVDMKRLTFAIAPLVLLLSGFYSVAQQSASGFVPVTDEMLQNPAPADWLMWRRTLNGWGYSPLDQINRTNVRNLRMVWTRGMGPGVQEATPLVYRGVMYLPNPSDLIQAMNAATGE